MSNEFSTEVTSRIMQQLPGLESLLRQINPRFRAGHAELYCTEQNLEATLWAILELAPALDQYAISTVEIFLSGELWQRVSVSYAIAWLQSGPKN